MFENYGLTEHEAQKPEINLAPFVDTIMILLIFFVVTANLYVITGIDVSKPKARSAHNMGQKAIMVGISREGAVHVYGRQVTLDRLQDIIQQEVVRMPDCSVLIVSDRETTIGKTVQVMDKCILAGVAKVSLAAEKQ
jgi:biopolymer transport protein ExbD